MTDDSLTPEERAWRKLQEPAPRGVYQHVGTWQRLNRRRQAFVSKIRREPDGCWVWTGQLSKRSGGKHYPAVSHRIDGKSVQRSAFSWLLDEFFPEVSATRPIRTSPACGNSSCINPLHRINAMATNPTITPGQAVEIYELKGKETARVVAERFGVNYNHVLSIWRGRNWSDVTGAEKKSPQRRVVAPEIVEVAIQRRGTVSSRALGRELGVSYKTILRIWKRSALSQEQGVC